MNAFQVAGKVAQPLLAVRVFRSNAFLYREGRENRTAKSGCATKKMRSYLFPLLLAGLCLHVLALPACAQESVIQFDPAQTKIEFGLGSTLHTVEGTFKLKSGTIRFDPATGKIGGAIIVDATSGESGNDGRDRKMHRDILESAKYPEIIFTPVEVKGAFNPKGASRLEVSGQFRLHGQDHPMTIPVDIEAEGSKLQILARITIPYIQWGLKNPSTFILRASDKVEIDLRTVGEIARS
jgi:polyisoprenoid-binding protein YceI